MTYNVLEFFDSQLKKVHKFDTYERLKSSMKRCIKRLKAPTSFAIRWI